MQLALLRQRDFGLLWTAGLISLAGDWVLSVAVPIAVYQLTGSAVATSGVVAVNVGARLLFGALAGVYVDRWDRRRVMVWANLLLAAALTPALLVTSAARVWVLFPVTFAHAVFSQFVRPAEHALLPQLVPAEQLAPANALNGLNNNLARLAGPAIGGVVAGAFGLRGAVLLDAASFLVAAALVGLIGGAHRAARAVPGAGQPARLAGELRAGLRAIRGSRVLTALFALVLVTSVGEGVMASLFAVFVGRELDGGARELGVLMSAQAVGGIAGGLGSAWVARRWRPARMVAVGAVIFGAVDLVIFNYPRWFSALSGEIALFVLVGAPGALLLAGALTLLQTEVPDALRGRVFAVVGVVDSGAGLLGTGIAATATGALGVVTVLSLQGLGYVVAGVAFAVLVRRAAAAGTEPVDEPQYV